MCCRKLNIFFIYLTQSYCRVLKDIGLNSAHYLTVKIPSIKILHKNAFNDGPNFSSKNFTEVYEKATKKNPIHFSLLILL